MESLSGACFWCCGQNAHLCSAPSFFPRLFLPLVVCPGPASRTSQPSISHRWSGAASPETCSLKLLHAHFLTPVRAFGLCPSASDLHVPVWPLCCAVRVKFCDFCVTRLCQDLLTLHGELLDWGSGRGERNFSVLISGWWWVLTLESCLGRDDMMVLALGPWLGRGWGYTKEDHSLKDAGPIPGTWLLPLIIGSWLGLPSCIRPQIEKSMDLQSAVYGGVLAAV